METRRIFPPPAMPPAPKKKRLPRLSRVAEEDRPPLRLTPRDKAIMQAVYEYRILTTPQIEALFFNPAIRSQCRLRLKLLFHHGYLYRDEQPQRQSDGSKSFVYWLDERGQKK